MVNYASKICQACSADATPATTREIEELLQNHQDWFLSTEVDFPQLQRVYIFRNFEEEQYEEVIYETVVRITDLQEERQP